LSNYDPGIQYEPLLKESRKRAFALASNLAALSEGHLLTYDFIKLKQTVERVAADADVAYAIVQLHNGKVAAYSGRSDLQGELLEDPVSQRATAAEKPLVQEITMPALAERGYDVAIPLFAPGSTRKWGTIRLGFSLAQAGLDHRAGHVASMAVPENKCLATVKGCNA